MRVGSKRRRDVALISLCLSQRADSKQTVSPDLSRRGDRSGTGDARLQTIELLKAGNRTTAFAVGDAFTQRITLEVFRRVGTSMFAIVITSGDGIAVHELWSVNEQYPR